MTDDIFSILGHQRETEGTGIAQALHDQVFSRALGRVLVGMVVKGGEYQGCYGLCILRGFGADIHGRMMPVNPVLRADAVDASLDQARVLARALAASCRRGTFSMAWASVMRATGACSATAQRTWRPSPPNTGTAAQTRPSTNSSASTA